MTRLLGVDLGERRIGLAVGDPHTGIARGFGTLRRGTLERDVATLRRIVVEQGVSELVVGAPLRMDGSVGTQAELTRAWAESVGAALALPVVLRDERLTSEGAEAVVGPARRGRSGGPPSPASRERQRATVDREAARHILQAELDARRATGSRTDPTAASTDAPAAGC